VVVNIGGEIKGKDTDEETLLFGDRTVELTLVVSIETALNAADFHADSSEPRWYSVI
jgi:hypothetical protein